MRWSVLLLVSCGVKFGDTGSRVSPSDAAAPTDAPSDAITGLYCARDRATSFELCSAVSACPALIVDPDAFPGCGFVPGSMEIACVCIDELCTLGKPKTCTEASAMLRDTTAATVCTQVAEGTCKRR